MPVKRCVSLLKSLDLLPDNSTIEELIDAFDLQVKEDNYPIFCEYVQEVFTKSIQNQDVLDFDDMLYFAVHYADDYPKYDMIYVDEAQDLSPIQIHLLEKLKGRVIAVGDPHQAIYAFRGADADAVPH